MICFALQINDWFLYDNSLRHERVKKEGDSNPFLLCFMLGQLILWLLNCCTQGNEGDKNIIRHKQSSDGNLLIRQQPGC